MLAAALVIAARHCPLPRGVPPDTKAGTVILPDSLIALLSPLGALDQMDLRTLPPPALASSGARLRR